MAYKESQIAHETENLNMTTITIPTAKLKAALICAAKKDIRYYLQGVLIEVSAGKVYIVGSDGHILAVYQCGDTEVADCQHILSNDDVKTVLKLAGKSSTVEFDVASMTIGALKLTPVDGRYPDWRRIIPSTENHTHTTEFISVNPTLTARAWESMVTAYKMSKSFPHQSHVDDKLCYFVDSTGVAVVMRLYKQDNNYDGLVGR